MQPPAPDHALAKAPTGISGLDAITGGGLPQGRPTLIAGAAGCGKTLFGVTFLVNGIREFDEPGVFITFEERPDDLAANVQSLGYDLPGLVAVGKLVIDHVRVERSEIEESGDYDLEGLFVRLGHAIDTVKARRVVLDTLEALFSGLGDGPVLRAELRRLFEWLKERGVTAVITGERGPGGEFTRYGIEEYVSDCVIALDNRVVDQVTTRRLRVVKYRGSAHGSNEYPFLIDKDGISVLPVTSAGLQHQVSEDAVSSGVAGIDGMLGLGGFFAGSSVLVSGTSGTGKSAFASYFINAACDRGEKAIFFSFEESPKQIIRNMRSLGLDLGRHVETGLLRFESARPSLFGLEMHLTMMNRVVEQIEPTVVVIDPISALRGPFSDVHAMLLRLVDLLKSRGVTAFFNSLTQAGQIDETEHGLSSLMDTWIALHDIEANGERNRGLYILKSRGMNHSNQIREYLLGPTGIELIEPYIGKGGVLTGSARTVQEEREAAERLAENQALTRRRREVDVRRARMEREIEERRLMIEIDAADLQDEALETDERDRATERERAAMMARRGGGE